MLLDYAKAVLISAFIGLWIATVAVLLDNWHANVAPMFAIIAAGMLGVRAIPARHQEPKGKIAFFTNQIPAFFALVSAYIGTSDYAKENYAGTGLVPVLYIIDSVVVVCLAVAGMIGLNRLKRGECPQQATKSSDRRKRRVR